MIIPKAVKNLCLELAALIDAGVHFVNATYYPEGDGPLIFSCYERLSAVAQAVAVDHYPNTDAVAREIANGNVAIHNQLMAQAKACIRPGLNFYQRKFSVQFRDTVRAFKASSTILLPCTGATPTSDISITGRAKEFPFRQQCHNSEFSARASSVYRCS